MNGLAAWPKTVFAAACLVAVLAMPAAAGAAKTSSLTRLETELLGPQHAAEHAALRAETRAAKRAWRRLPAAERRRQARLARAEERAQAHASAALDPAQFGKWTSGPFQLPVHAIHMALLPTGKVIFFSYPFHPEQAPGDPPTQAATAGDAWLFDPTKTPDSTTTADPTNEPDVFKHVPPPYDPETGGTASLFCAGLAFMPNGDLFVTGGTLRFPTATDPNHWGLKRAYTFNPWAEAWIQQPDMRHGRWYPSEVELPDGRMAVLAGTFENGQGDNYELEIFDPNEDPSGVGTWQYASQGNRSTDLYPHMTLLGNGKILLAGPGPGDSAVLDPSSLTWTNVGNHGDRRMYGTEMLEPNGTGPTDKVMEIGGFPDQTPAGQTTYPATSTSQIFDLSLPTPQWTAGPSLNVARADFQTVWLPDGSMVSIGGGNGRQNGSLYVLANGKPEHQIELFDPVQRQWRLGPAQQIDRAYHSTALLLPDGRVLSAGDDNAYVTGKPYEGSAHNSGEIYSPPYLFKGTRPKIASAPSFTPYGASFHVSVSDVDPAQAHAVLIPPGAVTHATNPNPRIVPLASTPTADGLDLVAPANANIAPRGWYMLFVVNSDGVPSVATWVHIGYDQDGPAPDPTPPPDPTPAPDPTPSPSPSPSPAPGNTQPLPGGGAPQPAITKAVEWVRASSHQSLKKGYVVAYLGIATNQSTIQASLLLPSGTSAQASLGRTLGKKVLHGVRAGTFKLVVPVGKTPAARHLLSKALKQGLVLRLRVSAPGAPAYSSEKRISNKG
jgi:hypothetical protein